MRYSTGLKKRSHLQGHRKRRRVFELKSLRASSVSGLSWTHYKTVRQYQAVGDILDEFKLYGFRGGVENMAQRDINGMNENGHGWLTEDASV